MAKAVFSPPKHWEDWASVTLGLWLLVSPWVLDFGGVAAAQNAVALGFLLIAAEFVELNVFRVWEEWVNVVLGAWLVISPWVLGADLVPAINFVTVGLLVLALALYEIWDEHRHSAHPV